MATTLRTFLDSHRSDSEWNLTGMSAQDKGKYDVPEDEYETFLAVLHSHIFGKVPRASSLLERHREQGPILVDLDLRYQTGGPLIRRFTTTHIRQFIAEYIAAMVYFAKVESLTQDLEFYHLEKPAPETDKSSHKDGVHIQCPTITTVPRFQYCIRGFLLARGVVEKIFGASGQSNAPEDCFDVSVIHRNNWFLYGACKPDKAQYKIAKIWRIAIDDIREALDGGDPTDYDELVEIIHDLLSEQTIPTDTLAIMKQLSIRRGHTTTTPIGIRHLRNADWDALMSSWGLGKARMDKPVKNTIENLDKVEEDRLVVSTTTNDGEDSRRVTSATAEDIALAYRLCKECVNAEHRAAEYQDWIRVAICLKNIANTDDSFKAWVDITRRVDPSHKKATYSEAELRAKWNLVRIDSSRKLSMATLVHWAREDNMDKYRSILSESLTSWIIHFAKDTHVNVASFVCRLYQHEFRCSPGASKGRVEWYQYPVNAHSWKHLRQSVELRARLSGGVKNEYVTAAMEIGKRLVSSTDDGERERLDEKRKKLFGIERQLEMSSFKDNVLKECQEKFYDEEFMTRLNTNPYLVGVANGVLDLRHYDNDSMEGRPHVVFRDGLPDDNISFQMGRCNPDLDPIHYFAYDPESPEQKFIAEFFRKIYPDSVLREYVITLLSSCLEGANKEQKFYVMQGPGSNGKSMIENLMEATFGDYGTSMSTTVFTRKKPDSGSANPDIVTVKCRRYIHMGEPDDMEKINTAIMKQYSGGDRVTARGLFEDQDKFVITGKIFMSCNDLPTVSKMDNGTWRRIRVIPHVAIFKDAGDPLINPEKYIYEKDLDLENKLKKLRTPFLSLLVHYYDTRYLVHGLREPDCVSAASNRYKEENDIFMMFFNDTYLKQPGAGPIKAIEVKKHFNEWKRNGNRTGDLKPQQVLDRMKEACGGGSTTSEFWSVAVKPDEADLSGALLSPVT